jgi:hypothetical protein
MDSILRLQGIERRMTDMMIRQIHMESLKISIIDNKD